MVLAFNKKSKGIMRVFQIYYSVKKGLTLKQLINRTGYTYQKYAKECKQLNATQFKPGVYWRYNKQYSQYTFYVFDVDGSWGLSLTCRQMFSEFMKSQGLDYGTLPYYNSHFDHKRPDNKVKVPIDDTLGDDEDWEM